MAKTAEIAVDARSDASSPYRTLQLSSRRSTLVSPTYGRFVGIMRVLLPTVATALIVIVALWPQFSDQQHRFSITPAKIGQEEARNLTMVNGTFTGVDEKRRPYTLTSDSVRLASIKSTEVRLKGPKADLLLENGSWVAVTAEQGVYHKDTKKLTLSGSVNLFHDSGYEFRTEGAAVNLMKGSARGTEPIQGQGPFGKVQAQGFIIHNRGERVKFTGRTTLVLNSGKVPGE